MKKSSLALFLVLMSLFIIAPNLQAQQLVCVEANGLVWCFNPNACGQACNDVCGTIGADPIPSNTTWFEAQNTDEKCQAISRAFGLGDDGNTGSALNGCLQDTIANNNDNAVGGFINPPLICSTVSQCPENHRTNVDQLGIPCDSSSLSRRSICPCGSPAEPNFPPPTITAVPAFSEWGLIAMAGVLGIVGFMVIRRRKVTA